MDYKYVEGYQSDNRLIERYFKFTQRVFQIDLNDWRTAGYWGKEYIPHSFIYNDQIIANISACLMQIQIQGQSLSAVQLGSVGVLPEYRGRGFSRLLMEKVLKKYINVPLVFLFANQSVLDFYPKFGFKRINESVSQVDLADKPVRNRSAKKIDIESECLKRLLAEKLQHSMIADARGNHSIYWFHLIYNYRNDLYYIEDKDVLFIAKYKGNCATVIDVLSTNPIRFPEISDYIIKRDTKKIIFHFTPDWLAAEYELIANEQDVMYARGEFPKDLANFKFPITAHT